MNYNRENYFLFALYDLIKLKNNETDEEFKILLYFVIRNLSNDYFNNSLKIDIIERLYDVRYDEVLKNVYTDEDYKRMSDKL
jgi:hypothetical protein